MRLIIIKELFSDASNGLIKYINMNQNIKSHVSVSSSAQGYGDINSFFEWGSTFQIVNHSHSVFLSYSFDSFSIRLTNYTMRGALNYCFSKSWELYGINKEKTRLIQKAILHQYAV